MNQDELTAALVGERQSASQIRRAHRGKSKLVVRESGIKQFVGNNIGVVRSQFDAVHSAPVSAGNIARSAITAERLAGIGRDSETDITGFKEGNREAHAATAESRRQEHERVDRLNGRDENEFGLDDGEGYSAPTEASVESTSYVRNTQEPSSRLPKTNVALNCEETTALYARRHRNG